MSELDAGFEIKERMVLMRVARVAACAGFEYINGLRRQVVFEGFIYRLRYPVMAALVGRGGCRGRRRDNAGPIRIRQFERRSAGGRIKVAAAVVAVGVAGVVI